MKSWKMKSLWLSKHTSEQLEKMKLNYHNQGYRSKLEHHLKHEEHKQASTRECTLCVCEREANLRMREVREGSPLI